MTASASPRLNNTLPRLSDRERQVLTLVAAGHSNPDIARDLRIALGTVKKYLDHAMTKLSAENRAHAVAVGFREGLLR